MRSGRRWMHSTAVTRYAVSRMANAPSFASTPKPKIVEEVVQRVVEGNARPALALNDAPTSRFGGTDPSTTRRAEWRTAGAWGDGKGRAEAQARDAGRAAGAWDVAGILDPRAATACLTRHGADPRAPLATGRLEALARDAQPAAPSTTDRGPGPHRPDRTPGCPGTLVADPPLHLDWWSGFALERGVCRRQPMGRERTSSRTPLSFFDTTGAYRVDRRPKHALYKDVLALPVRADRARGTTACSSPAARGRSGVERRLKLGPAGTDRRLARTAQAGKPQPVFFRPRDDQLPAHAEAETLIDDFSEEARAATSSKTRRVDALPARVASFAQSSRGWRAW